MTHHDDHDSPFMEPSSKLTLAIEYGPFMVDLPLKIVIVQGKL